MMERLREPRAFTLSEIVIALGVFSMVSLAIIGVFTKLLTSSHKSSEQSAAELLAITVLERASRSGPSDWGLAPGEVSRRLETSDRSSGTEFHYQLTPSLLKTGPHGSLYQLDISVSWSNSGTEEVVLDDGKQWINKSKTVYVESL